MVWSLAPYIHVILADVVSITLYINKPLVRLTTVHYQSAVSMISFAQVLTAQWSDTIPKRNIRFFIGITSPDIPFQHLHPNPFFWSVLETWWHQHQHQKMGREISWWMNGIIKNMNSETYLIEIHFPAIHTWHSNISWVMIQHQLSNDPTGCLQGPYPMRLVVERGCQPE